MKPLNGSSIGPKDVPEQCERCGAPLRTLVGLFGRKAIDFHNEQHKRADQTQAASALLAGAEAVAMGNAPVLILLPLCAGFRMAFDLPLVFEENGQN